MRCFVLSFAFVLVARVAANELSCPPNSKGTHPKCICADLLYFIFFYIILKNEINRICATTINANLLLAKCPKGSEGQFPACICGEGKVCVRERDECVVIDRTQCPIGSKKVNNKCVCDNVNEFKYEFDEIFWICRPWYIPTTPAPPPPCPAHQHRVLDICEWDRCPAGYESKSGYWPDCVPVRTCAQEGKTGQYPNCHAIVVVQHCSAQQTGRFPDCHWLPCPDNYITKTGYWPDCRAPPSCSDIGMKGVYPDCRSPPPTCPPYYHRNSDGECVRVKCPPGHEGDYQPNCKLVPKCPPEYPGVWPNCNIYATTPRNARTTAATTTIRTTYPSTTRATPRPTFTTTIRTTTQPARCSCDCYSDEIVIFKDNVVRDPSRKYKIKNSQLNFFPKKI